jgi:hypothetical protein
MLLDPERLLWVPGKKLISIPAPRIRLPEFVYYIDRFRNVRFVSSAQLTVWARDEYFESGWDARVNTISSTPMTGSSYSLDRMRVELTQKQDWTGWA